MVLLPILNFLATFSLCTLSLAVFLFHCFLVQQLMKMGKRLCASTLSGIFGNTFLVARLLVSLSFYTRTASMQSATYWMQCAWLSTIVEYWFVVLFFENLLKKRPHFERVITLKEKFSIVLFCAIFFYDTLGGTIGPGVFLCVYAYGLATLFSILYGMQHILHTAVLPRILVQQGTFFLKIVFKPYLVCAVHVFLITLLQGWQGSTYFLYGITLCAVPALILGLLWCGYTLIKLRFLNRTSDVTFACEAAYMDLFSQGVQELLKAKNIPELKNSLIALFKRAFDIPSEHIIIHIFSSKEEEMMYDYQFRQDAFATIVQEALIPHLSLLEDNGVMRSQAPEGLAALIADSKVLIREDLEFTAFYEPLDLQEAIQFLDTLRSDVFMPLYSRSTLLGYIRFARQARPKNFFTGMEKRLLIAWGAYLDHIVHLIRYANFEKVVTRQKELIEYAYEQYQQLEHYRESFENLDKYDKEGTQGIVVYKNRHLFGDKRAHALLSNDVFTNPLHALAKTLRTSGSSIERMRIGQRIAITDSEGKKLTVFGMYAEPLKSVLFLIGYPDRLELLSQAFKYAHHLDRPYALYLETTKNGALLNELMPACSKTFSLFKVAFLKAALSKKVILLDIPTKDLLPSVEVIHAISMRSQLHVLGMKEPEKNHEVAATLFGFTHHFQDSPLLQKLNDVGTLFIENVHLLELKTQERLAEFISCGFFRPLRSTIKIESNVRLIVSSPHNLQLLAQEGRFSLALASILNAHRLYFPCLAHVSTDELHEAIIDYGYQILRARNLLYPSYISAEVRNAILELYPASLYELKSAIDDALAVKRLPKIAYYEDMTTAHEEVEHALRLGKNALKDMRVMAVLWKRFGNCAHIATLLGVHRSSVLKRCREYNLIDVNRK